MAKKIVKKKVPTRILITDTHLSEDNVAVNKSIWEQATNYCLQYKVGLSHVGDIWKARKGQTDELLQVFREIVEECVGKLDIYTPIVAVTGNHDKTNNLGFISFSTQYDDSQTFIAVQASYRQSIDNTDIYYLSYFTEGKGIYEEELQHIIKYIDKTKTNILLTHIAVNGVRNNNGSEVTIGVDKNLFNNFDSVIVGHYHNRSKVGENIHYIGSTFPHNYGENNDKGIVLLYSDGSFEYLATEFPIFETIEIPFEEFDDFISEFNQSENSNIRLQVKGTEAQLKTISLSAFQEVPIKIEKKTSEVASSISIAENDEIIIFDIEGIKTSFETFCEELGIDEASQKIGLKFVK